MALDLGLGTLLGGIFSGLGSLFGGRRSARAIRQAAQQQYDAAMAQLDWLKALMAPYQQAATRHMPTEDWLAQYWRSRATQADPYIQAMSQMGREQIREATENTLRALRASTGPDVGRETGAMIRARLEGAKALAQQGITTGQALSQAETTAVAQLEDLVNRIVSRGLGTVAPATGAAQMAAQAAGRSAELLTQAALNQPNPWLTALSSGLMLWDIASRQRQASNYDALVNRYLGTQPAMLPAGIVPGLMLGMMTGWLPTGGMH